MFEDFSFITTIPEVVALIEEVGEPNVGIALDAWHIGEGPEVAGQIIEHADRILAFHLNDRRGPTRSWYDRVLPGAGTGDLVGAIRALENAGFDGWYELEVVSDDGRVEQDFPRLALAGRPAGADHRRPREVPPDLGGDPDGRGHSAGRMSR